MSEDAHNLNESFKSGNPENLEGFFSSKEFQNFSKKLLFEQLKDIGIDLFTKKNKSEEKKITDYKNHYEEVYKKLFSKLTPSIQKAIENSKTGEKITKEEFYEVNKFIKQVIEVAEKESN